MPSDRWGQPGNFRKAQPAIFGDELADWHYRPELGGRTVFGRAGAGAGGGIQRDVLLRRAGPQAPERDYLFSLRFPQKTALWLAFLRDGFQPIEFDWLAEEIEENTLLDRIEWELALEEVMDQLKFRLVNGEKTFSLFDGGGNKLYFGATVTALHKGRW